MDKKEYLLTQMKLVALAKQAQPLKLDEFLRQINSAEQVAPILDPSLYMMATANLTAVKNLAIAFERVQAAFSNFEKAIIETAVKQWVKNNPDESPDEKEEKDPHEKLTE